MSAAQKTGESPPEFLSMEEAAKLLRVSRNTLYAAAQRGEIKGLVKVGRLLRVRRSALMTDEDVA
jgi:excisionase family DNA binding protein